jgi:hypothetical protein
VDSRSVAAQSYSSTRTDLFVPGSQELKTARAAVEPAVKMRPTNGPRQNVLDEASFRNLFMRKLTRDRLVPIIFAGISCETVGITF